MSKVRTAGRVTAAVCSAVVIAGMTTAPAHAGKPGDPLLDFQGRISKYTNGLSCGAVPTTDGGSMALVMRVNTDSSARTASVTYSIGSGPILSATGGFLVGEGKVMVLKGTQWGYPSGTAERPGPPSARRDTCSYGNPGGSGEAELVHLVPVKRPTAAQVQAWCETEPWYPYFPGSCPIWGLD